MKNFWLQFLDKNVTGQKKEKEIVSFFLTWKNTIMKIKISLNWEWTMMKLQMKNQLT